MKIFLLLYVVAGCGVYLLVDTRAIAAKLSGPTLGPSYGEVQRFLFPAILALWPLVLLFWVLRRRD